MPAYIHVAYLDEAKGTDVVRSIYKAQDKKMTVNIPNNLPFRELVEWHDP